MPNRFTRLFTSPLRAYDTTLQVSVQDWQAFPPLVNAWTAGAPTPQYWIDPWRIVHCTGLLTAGTILAGTVVTTFPVGARPQNGENFLCNGAGAAVVVINIAVNGDLSIKINGGTFFANQLSWRAST